MIDISYNEFKSVRMWNQNYPIHIDRSNVTLRDCVIDYTRWNPKQQGMYLGKDSTWIEGLALMCVEEYHRLKEVEGKFMKVQDIVI